MPLASVVRHLEKARAQAYAIPLFEVFEASTVEDVVAALEQRQAPGIIGVYAPLATQRNTAAVIACARELAAGTHAPVSIMLDHGRSVEECRQALALGFTDIMYDGSGLPIEENIANTAEVARFAHDAGLGVEAELGKVGVGEEYRTFGGAGKGFTDPAAVERFVAATGVDLLAVAFGNAHGTYAAEPKLDLDLLDSIRRRVPIPLVMHGGSGLSEEQFRGSVKAGIVKINIATDLMNRMTAAVKETAARPASGFFDVFKAVHATMFERCCHYLDLFGTSGTARP